MNLSYIRSLCAIAGLSMAFGASALTRATTAEGRPFVTGGVGTAEQGMLESEHDRYSLWAITAARGSGAYLADVHVRITDDKSRIVFDRRLDGPWLMIDLPRGRYAVEAVYQGQAKRRTASIGSGDHDQMVFYFDVPDNVPQAASR